MKGGYEHSAVLDNLIFVCGSYVIMSSSVAQLSNNLYSFVVPVQQMEVGADCMAVADTISIPSHLHQDPDPAAADVFMLHITVIWRRGICHGWSGDLHILDPSLLGQRARR